MCYAAGLRGLDAAVTLVERRRRPLHLGGRLGRRLLRHLGLARDLGGLLLVELRVGASLLLGELRLLRRALLRPRLRARPAGPVGRRVAAMRAGAKEGVRAQA